MYAVWIKGGFHAALLYVRGGDIGEAVGQAVNSFYKLYQRKKVKKIPKCGVHYHFGLFFDHKRIIEIIGHFLVFYHLCIINVE